MCEVSSTKTVTGEGPRAKRVRGTTGVMGLPGPPPCHRYDPRVRTSLHHHGVADGLILGWIMEHQNRSPEFNCLEPKHLCGTCRDVGTHYRSVKKPDGRSFNVWWARIASRANGLKFDSKFLTY